MAAGNRSHNKKTPFQGMMPQSGMWLFQEK
jgi:hypothetical protein